MGRWKIAVPIADFDWGEHNERHQENYGFPVNGPPNKMHHTVDMGEGTMNPNYDKLKRVLKGGLVPRNWHIRPQDTEGEYGGRSYLQSRPNHVYLGEYPWTPYGLPQIHVDKKHLDPQLINPDEDYWGGGDGQLMIDDASLIPTKANLEAAHEDNPDAPATLGEWAQDNSHLDDYALDSLEDQHTIAYNGAIPAEHIELNPAWYKRHALMRNMDAGPIPDWLQEHVAIQHPEVAQNAQADNSFRKEIKQDGSFLSKKLDHFYTMSRNNYSRLPVALVQDSMRELANRMADTEATLTRQKYSPDQITLKMGDAWDDLMPFYDTFLNIVNSIQTRAPGFRFPYEEYPSIMVAAQDAKRIINKMDSNEGFDPTKEFERYEPPKQSNTWREAAFVKEAPHKTPESEMGIYGWPAIMLKAQRLRNEGRVLVTHNDGKTVVGQVEGDHNLYDTEIYREDPNSAVITWWDCSCAWRKFAFGRTRKWKKYEARICSHGLALYWESLKGKKQAVPADLPANEIADYPANYNVRNPGQEIPLPYVAPESIPAMEAEEQAQEQEEGNFPPILGEPVEENPVNLENPDTQRLTKTIKEALDVVHGHHNPNHYSSRDYPCGNGNASRWTQRVEEEDRWRAITDLNAK